MEDGKTDGQAELVATADTIFDFIQENGSKDLGTIAMVDLHDFLREFFSGTLSKLENSTKNPYELKYHDFLELVSPRSKDFTELMHQR